MDKEINKQICPSGVLTESKLKRVYTVLFPNGDSDEYAHFIFMALDRNQDGLVCFDDLAITCSVLLKGTPTEKFEWIFDFYSGGSSHSRTSATKSKKTLTRLDMLKVVKSFFDLIAPDASPDLSFSLVNAIFWASF